MKKIPDKCLWCGDPIESSEIEIENSHGICDKCVTAYIAAEKKRIAQKMIEEGNLEAAVEKFGEQFIRELREE